jgi:glyoxylase-like metal-dependent hydrolase (beta-lactamase superfamily II)
VRRRKQVTARTIALLLLAALLLAAVVVVWRAPEAAAWRYRIESGGVPVMSAGAPVLSAGLHWADDYYAVADLGQRAFAIGEPKYGQCNFSYLIVGTQRALLFDTGPGVRDISPLVRSMLPASMPLEVLPSHLHFDHTGNLHHFDHVVLPDLPALHDQVRDGSFHLGFYQSLGFVEGFPRVPFHVSRWIEPGAVLDLGGRRLEMLSLPGHTPDSVVLYDRQANRVFAGDFIYPTSIYAFLPHADLSSYAASARRLRDLIDDRTRVYGAHGCDHPQVDVPTLTRADVAALETALTQAAAHIGRLGTGWYPRVVPVNDRMRLLATYPWMAR